MRIIVFDAPHMYKEADISRIASIGIKEIITFDFWCETEPKKGKYSFQRLLDYERLCMKYGIHLIIMASCAYPTWAPKDCYLKNEIGSTNNSLEKSGLTMESR